MSNKREIRIWIILLLLNSLLFLPRYIMEAGSSSFFPFHLIFAEPGLEKFVAAFGRRHNYDIFRISLDLFFLSSIFYFFRKRINTTFMAIFACCYFTILLLFLIYYSAFYRIYLIEPILYQDAWLFKLAAQNVNIHVYLILLLVLLVVGALGYIFYRIFKYLLLQLKEVQWGIGSNIAFYVICFLLLFNTIRSGIVSKPAYTMQLTTALLADNIRQSFHSASNAKQFNISHLNKLADTAQYTLKEKPDIYFLFIESYGDIINTHPKLKAPFENCLAQCDSLLRDKGWNAASTLSISPVSGGRSWFSYTSTLFGFRIDNHQSYTRLLKDPRMSNFPHVIRWLQSQGYSSYWVNSMSGNSDMDIPWDLYGRFYSVDHWIRYKDLNYTGKLYGFGPAPPDQYVYHFARESMEKDSVHPHVLFYICQNSHNPFNSPNAPVADWRSLNSIDAQNQKSVIFEKPTEEGYLKAMQYELNTITSFIISDTKKRNAIYILIGDHQPPVLTTEKDDFLTPVHIISTDTIFLAQFVVSGFTGGLKRPYSSMKPSLHHEGIISLLKRKMVMQYGANSTALPEYQPAGLKITQP